MKENIVGLVTGSNDNKDYLLYRINDGDKKDPNGKDLLIVPLPQTETKNSIRITNFNFERALSDDNSFGIKLGYLSEHSKFIVNEPSIEINNYSAVLLNDKKDNTVSTIYDNLSCDGAVLYKWAGQGADYEAMVLDKNGLKVKDKDAIALIPPSNSLLREIRPLTDDGRWYVCYSNYAEADFDHSENGRGSGVLMKIFDNKGNVVKDTFSLVDTTIVPGEYKNFGSILSFPNGNFVVQNNLSANDNNIFNLPQSISVGIE